MESYGSRVLESINIKIFHCKNCGMNRDNDNIKVRISNFLMVSRKIYQVELVK